MSNFTFIPAPWASLAATPLTAEQEVHRAPLYAAMLCRKSLEEWVRWMYTHDADLKLPFNDNLSALLHEEEFKTLVAPMQAYRLNLIRKLGNAAVHTRARIESGEVLQALKILHGFIGWVTTVYGEEKPAFQAFDENLMPRESGKDKSREELRRLEDAFLAQQESLEKLESELARYKANKEARIELVPAPPDPDENATRKIYIDILLREAGWDPYGPGVAEYPLAEAMPLAEGKNGNGRADYVLWGKDGKPLAVVEAKRTRRDPRVGQHQAWLYAGALEKQFGRRPIIFFTNGFETWLWDDLRYPPRSVDGFYTRDELEWLIQQRQGRKPLAPQTINNKITERYYQHEAIRKVAEALERNQREALLVMATGTGKTRVAASLVDFLSKAGWVKKVLFLADRNALVHQAKNSFNDQLPHLPSIDLTRDKEDEHSRVVFSTYQTMINLIDGEKDGDDRYYGPGHFDLVIFDEIHRSVYNRYKSIFRYFDGIRLGLTATPKAEADRDTYALFNLEPHHPTYAYELDQAVDDGFLVPPRAISVPLKFQRSGIKYKELSEEEKREYEAQFSDPLTGAFPDEIDAAALNKWLFNQDTVDKVLGHLMEKGIKVEGGDKLAKTIIFARSHQHAEFIRQRFDLQYPGYGGHFLAVIDYQQEYRYDLLNHFKGKSKMPQIAVSVDMLDTGIDVPEVCNLVFFKPVRSSAKFWQMIGRGTRLCEHLFAWGVHKQEFLIFDFCQNFEFFNANPRGTEGRSPKSLSQRLFILRLRLAYVLMGEEDPAHIALGQELLEVLISQTQALNTESFLVRQHWREVEKYRDAAAWTALTELDLRVLMEEVAPLVLEVDEDEMAKRFDLLMLDLQLSILQDLPRLEKLVPKLMETAHQLSKKTSIPMVAVRRESIEVARTFQERKEDIHLVEKLRRELRDIIRFIDQEKTQVVFTDFEDEIGGNIREELLVFRSGDLAAYRRKVEQYLHSQRNYITIYKLRNNIPITSAELEALERMLFEQGSAGSREELERAYGHQPLGGFIRSILGMEANAAKQAFGKLLEERTLNAQQIRFIDTIINFFTSEGIVDPDRLFDPPFTDISSEGIMGLFDEATSTHIIDLIRGINRNAGVA